MPMAKQTLLGGSFFGTSGFVATTFTDMSIPCGEGTSDCSHHSPLGGSPSIIALHIVETSIFKKALE